MMSGLSEYRAQCYSDNITSGTSKLFCSRLYEILKSSPMSGSVTSNAIGDSCDVSIYRPRLTYLNGKLWQCWQCMDHFVTDKSLAKHLRACKMELPEDIAQLGCPFCPKDVHQSSDVAFNIKSFDLHLRRRHPDVRSLRCCYCMTTIRPPTLKELVCHTIEEHKIPWRPSPASLVYLRNDNLPHRVVTCMGCGWCTFVLRADNAAQPPSSLSTHLDRCIFTGGRVHLERFDSGVLPLMEQLIHQADRTAWAFAEAFPLVRGYTARINSGPSPRKHRYIRYEPENPMKIPKMDPGVAPLEVAPGVELARARDYAGEEGTEEEEQVTLCSPMDTMDTMVLRPETEDDGGTALETDENVGDHIMPGEEDADVYKAPMPTRLYVCPLCGDNALASLRKRDEHLQAVHRGERVFPCQICGMAYPLYIMLRKHAAVKHDADFDAVRYGPPELVDHEPVECHICQLVAFTDPAVLQLHLLALHQKETKQHVTGVPYPDNLLAGATRGAHLRGSRGHTSRSYNMSYRNNSRHRPTYSGRPPPTSRIYQDEDDDDEEEEERQARQRRKMPPIGQLERILSEVTGYPSPLSCRICRTTVDNEKELWLHLELDHSESEKECEQLGCQACGRIFFGPGGRVDLIGHLRVVHQDSDRLDAALTCPHADMAVKRNSGFPIAKRPCDALFSSPRLRHIHSTVSSVTNPGFSCPLNLGGAPEPGDRDPDRVRITIMKTEIAADREGLMILAYCCPSCSRLFAGDQATARFAAHHRTCQASVVATNDLVLVSDRPTPTSFADTSHLNLVTG